MVINQNIYISTKYEGETLAVFLDRIRHEKRLASDIPLTYAGRLDPMAEGLVIVLAGEECKKKEEYLGLDKVYEYEVLFGVETDTFDILGIPRQVSSLSLEVDDLENKIRNILPKFLGKILQTYPPYSSKPINGVPLFQLAREGKIDESDVSREASAKWELPKNNIEIYSHEFLGLRTITGGELSEQISERIKKVTGDFRQEEILNAWDLSNIQDTEYKFIIASFRISCSSGTYIRRIASDMGKLFGIGTLAWRIKRTKVGNYKL